MNILIDYHHGALFRSLIKTLHERLGHNLFCPAGSDWGEINLYKCAHYNEETFKQMTTAWINFDQFPEFKPVIPLSYKEYKNTHIDFHLSTLWDNLHIYKKIAEEKNSKVGFHVGNNFATCQVNQAENVISSAWPSYICGTSPNKVFCRQEFDTNLYKQTKPKNIKSIGCFKNFMGMFCTHFNEVDLWEDFKKALPDFDFKAYGGGNPDGIISDREEIMSKKMSEFGFIYHNKDDEGYGHVLHNAFALGKPVITNLRYMHNYVEGTEEEGIRYKNSACHIMLNDEYGDEMRANFTQYKEEFVIDLSEGFDICVDKIRKISENYDYYSDLTYNRFLKIVDWQKEADGLQVFLDNLL